MSVKSSEIRLKVSQETRDLWNSFCKSQKVSGPEMFEMILARLGGGSESETNNEDEHLTKTSRVYLRLTNEQLNGLSEISKSEGYKYQTQFLRALIDEVISGQRRVTTDADHSSAPKKNRVYLRFTERQYKKIHSLAITQSFDNATKYVKSLVLGAITKSPILTEDEINILRESNRELAAIGRNLNQVAKKLNIEFRDRESLTKQMIEELIDTVDEHRDRVSELIEKNLTRWKDL